jgi:hypothetical protein
MREEVVEVCQVRPGIGEVVLEFIGRGPIHAQSNVCNTCSDVIQLCIECDGRPESRVIAK